MAVKHISYDNLLYFSEKLQKYISEKLDNFLSFSQKEAINSGITAEKLENIENNIVELQAFTEIDPTVSSLTPADLTNILI